MKNKIFFFLAVSIALVLNSCDNTTEPGEISGSIFEMPVVPGLVLTTEISPAPIGIWRNPHLPRSIYYAPVNPDSNILLPYDMQLNIPYPNPTSSSITILYTLPIRTEVSITLVKARLPEERVDGPASLSGGVFISSYKKPAIILLDKVEQEPGHYSVVWSGKNNKGENAPGGFYRVYFNADGNLLWCDVLLARSISDLPPELRGKVLFEN